MSVRAHQTNVNTIPSAITRHVAAWRRRTRFVLLRLHRWLGLGIGILLVLIGLTGSFNVFYREIDAALNPVLYSPAGPERDASIDDVLSAAAEADSARIAAILAPDRVWPVWVVMHIHRGEEGSYPARWTTMVDPSNGRVLGRRDYTNSFAFTIYRLHYTLLLYPWWGRELVGVIGIGLLCSALSGLYLWWPRNHRFWRSVSLHKGVSPQRPFDRSSQCSGLLGDACAHRHRRYWHRHRLSQCRASAGWTRLDGHTVSHTGRHGAASRNTTFARDPHCGNCASGAAWTDHRCRESPGRAAQHLARVVPSAERRSCAALAWSDLAQPLERRHRARSHLRRHVDR